LSETEGPIDRRVHERLAKEINGEVWALLDKPDRTEDEDERMVLAAHASTYHWLEAGTNVHRQRGEWMLAHVHTVLGRDGPARHHARLCLALTEGFPGEMMDFDIAYAYEAVARAAALAEDGDGARRYRHLAEVQGARIADEEDRTIFLADLQRGPWFGLAAADSG
jgi:hypothetical protein